MVTERQASQCLTYFIDSKAEIAASSVCPTICGISPRCQLAFQNHGAGLTIMLFLCMFSLDACSFSISHGWCVCSPRQLSAALTGDSFTQGWPGSEVQKQAALESSLVQSPATPPLQSRLGGPQIQTAESHYCVSGFLWSTRLFSKGNHNGGIWQLPRRAPPGPLGRHRAVLAFVWRRARGSPHGPAPEECGLLQYFLSIHCGHFGKGWVTI